MWQKNIRFLIVAWILSIFCLSLYAGFSYHADKFCTIPLSSYSGRNGSVAIWLQRFGSVSTIFFIIWAICIHLSYYKTWFYNGHREINEKSRRNNIKKFGLYMLDFIFAYFFLDGLFVLIYVPNACKHNRISDNYCYVAMLIVLLADILTFIVFGCIISPEETLALEESYDNISVVEENKEVSRPEP